MDFQFSSGHPIRDKILHILGRPFSNPFPSLFSQWLFDLCFLTIFSHKLSNTPTCTLSLDTSP